MPHQTTRLQITWRHIYHHTALPGTQLCAVSIQNGICYSYEVVKSSPKDAIHANECLFLTCLVQHIKDPRFYFPVNIKTAQWRWKTYFPAEHILSNVFHSFSVCKLVKNFIKLLSFLKINVQKPTLKSSNTQLFRKITATCIYCHVVRLKFKDVSEKQCLHF
jgi:hypothetical protein